MRVWVFLAQSDMSAWWTCAHLNSSLNTVPDIEVTGESFSETTAVLIIALLSGPCETLATFFFLIILSGNFKGPCKMGEAEKFKRNYLNWKVLMQMQHEQLCRAQSLRCLLWPRVFAQDRTMPCHLWSGAAYALFFLAMTSLWKIQCNKVLVTAKACVFTFICS